MSVLGEIECPVESVIGYISPEQRTLIVSEDESKNIVEYRYAFVEYSISFNDDGGSRDVTYNITDERVDEPEITERTGHTAKWSEYTLEHTTDQVVKAVYTPIEYRIDFVNGGETVQSGELAYGETITAPAEIPVKADDERFRYVFDRWDGFTEGMKVTGPVTFTAVFTNYVRLPEPTETGGYVIDMSDESSAVFKSDTVETIVENAKNNPSTTLEISTADSTLLFDNAALKGFRIGENATVSVTEVDKSEIGPEYHLNYDGNTMVYDMYFGSNRNFGEGTVTVSLSYELANGLDPKNLKVLYISDGNEPIGFECVYENGKITFVTNHFSMYAIVYEEPSDAISVTVILGALATAAAIIAAVVLACDRKSA